MNFNIVEFEASFGLSSQLPKSNIPEIVFAGRSNVGKSSMINKLFNRKQLAKVSSVPGKTITINFYRLGGVRFVDLPGYGYAKRSAAEIRRFGELMEGYFNSGRNIKLIVQLIDMRHSPTSDDIDMINFMLAKDLPFVIVLTKSDKLKPTERQKRLEALNEELAFLGDREVEVIEFSAQTGVGLKELRSYIDDVLEQK